MSKLLYFWLFVGPSETSSYNTDLKEPPQWLIMTLRYDHIIGLYARRTQSHANNRLACWPPGVYTRKPMWSEPSFRNRKYSEIPWKKGPRHNSVNCGNMSKMLVPKFYSLRFATSDDIAHCTVWPHCETVARNMIIMSFLYRCVHK